MRFSPSAWISRVGQASWPVLVLAAAMAQENRDGLLPPDASTSVARVRQALAANDLAAAETEAAALASREPGGFESFFWSGYVAYRQAKYYDAIRALRRAEALNANPFVLKVLALSYHG